MFKKVDYRPRGLCIGTFPRDNRNKDPNSFMFDAEFMDRLSLICSKSQRLWDHVTNDSRLRRMLIGPDRTKDLAESKKTGFILGGLTVTAITAFLIYNKILVFNSLE